MAMNNDIGRFSSDLGLGGCVFVSFYKNILQKESREGGLRLFRGVRQSKYEGTSQSL